MNNNPPDHLSGRDHFLISRALYVAARALRAQEHPPHSDIRGMNDLLDRYYVEHKEMYEWQTSLQLALRLGYKRKKGACHREDVERWLAEHHPDHNVPVVALHARRAGRDPEDRH